jgi:hypothetical protein
VKVKVNVTDMRHVRRRTSWCAACGLLIAGGGCGYSSNPLQPQTIRTVYVEMFQSKEFRRGLEMQLTEAIRKEIDRGTPYRNAPKNRADTILSGEILEVRQATLGIDFLTDMPRELAATFVISYRWKDMRTGRILVDNPQFTQTVEYVPPIKETFYIASEEAANKLARRIVDSMETGW